MSPKLRLYTRHFFLVTPPTRLRGGWIPHHLLFDRGFPHFSLRWLFCPRPPRDVLPRLRWLSRYGPFSHRASHQSLWGISCLSIRPSRFSLVWWMPSCIPYQEDGYAPPLHSSMDDFHPPCGCYDMGTFTHLFRPSFWIWPPGRPNAKNASFLGSTLTIYLASATQSCRTFFVSKWGACSIFHFTFFMPHLPLSRSFVNFFRKKFTKYIHTCKKQKWNWNLFHLSNFAFWILHFAFCILHFAPPISLRKTDRRGRRSLQV